MRAEIRKQSVALFNLSWESARSGDSELLLLWARSPKDHKGTMHIDFSVNK